MLLEILLTVIAILIPIFFGIYLYLKHLNTYWARRGIVHEKPELFYGNVRMVGRNKSYRQTLREFYLKYKTKTPFGGYYLLTRRTAILFDLDLIKNVLIKDFNYFPQRGSYYNEKSDPLTAHLANLEVKKWRKLRAKLTPTFSSGKMKFMLPTIIEVAERFTLVLENELVAMNSRTIDESEISIDMKELLACFTTDVIGTCAFGLECNSLKDPNTKFRIMSKRALTAQRHGRILFAIQQTFQDFSRKLGLKMLPDDLANFFMDIVRETVSKRERENIKRNDFMNLLIELKNKAGNEALTLEEIAAQCYIFFLAGFETSSSTLSFCLYELALNPNIQERVRTEIFEMLERYNGEVTYDGLKELKYLQQVIQETLRLYTLLNSIVRISVDDYKLPNTELTIERNTLILIPIDAIHHDPDIYPEPEKFKPERFAAGEAEKRHSMSYLPFGEGPRNCIGSRFGEMQVLVGLTMLLRKFRFSTSKFTQIPLQFKLRSIILSSKDGIHLKVELLK